MAGIQGYLNTSTAGNLGGEVALVGGTAKTVLAIFAPANHRLKLVGVEVMFKGTVVTDTPVRIRLGRATTAGTSTAATPVKADPTINETLQATGGANFTAEPTYGDIIRVWDVHPQTGVVYFLPLGVEIPIPGDQTNNLHRLGLECLAAQNQTVAANFIYEE